MQSNQWKVPHKASQGALNLTAQVLLLSMTLCSVAMPAWAGGEGRGARYAPAFDASRNSTATMEPKNVPDFASSLAPAAQDQGTSPQTAQPGTPLRAGAASTTIPVETRLRLILESAVDAKMSQPGDIFEAHVKDDLFLGTNLLLAKGSFVRGRVCEVTKPRLLSRAAKIGLKLEQIVTPTGEVIPLDAGLEFHKGMTNAKGQLDPGTNLVSHMGNKVKQVTGGTSQGSTRDALIGLNVATLGAPAIATAIGSGAIGLFRSGDNVNLTPGQELEVLLTNDLGLQLN
ncbi:MAG TPA: hypothetical protein V6C97_22530 [Oculatellaceae cyanobacterium]